jgi:hypothetical protein
MQLLPKAALSKAKNKQAEGFVGSDYLQTQASKVVLQRTQPFTWKTTKQIHPQSSQHG